MLSVLFTICFLYVFIKLFILGVKAAWGIVKFLLTIVLLPVVLIALAVSGLIFIAFPIVIVIGIAMLVLD